MAAVVQSELQQVAVGTTNGGQVALLRPGELFPKGRLHGVTHADFIQRVLAQVTEQFPWCGSMLVVEFIPPSGDSFLAEISKEVIKRPAVSVVDATGRNSVLEFDMDRFDHTVEGGPLLVPRFSVFPQPGRQKSADRNRACAAPVRDWPCSSPRAMPAGSAP